MDRTARSEEVPRGHGESSGEAARAGGAKRAMARPFHAAESALLRLALRPGAAWALAWIFVFSGGLVFDPARGALEAVAACVCGALFGGLTWVGALGFAHRRNPPWILPAVLALGLARGVVFATYGPAAAGAMSLIFEPALLLAAVVVLSGSDLLRPRPVLRVALPGALLALAGLEVVDALAPLGAPLPDTAATSLRDTTVAWFALGVVAACAELWALRAWSADRERAFARAADGQRALEAEVARQRRTNQLLRRREAWLFDFFEKAPDLLLVLAPETHEILRCNRRFSEALGRPRRALVGRSLIDLLAPDTVETVRPLLSGHRRLRRNLMLHLLRRDGTELVVLANLALQGEADGPPEVRAVLHDVTRLERAGSLDLHDVHRALARELPAGVFHADERGRCAFVNASFCELTGLSPDEARQGGWLAGVHPDDRPRVERAWQAAVRDGTVVRVEHRVRPGAGPSERVLTECIPISDAPVGGFAGSMTSLAGLGLEATGGAGRPHAPRRDATGGRRGS